MLKAFAGPAQATGMLFAGFADSSSASRFVNRASPSANFMEVVSSMHQCAS